MGRVNGSILEFNAEDRFGSPQAAPSASASGNQSPSSAKARFATQFLVTVDLLLTPSWRVR